MGEDVSSLAELTGGPQLHRWAKGWGMFAILSLPDAGQRDAVLLDYGRPGGPRAMVLLDEGGDLAFEVSDKADRQRRISAPGALLADGHRHTIVCDVAPLGSGEWKLTIDIDGAGVADAVMSAEFDEASADNLLTVGSDLLGQRPGRFELFSLGTTGEAIGASYRVKLYKWSKVRYGVGRDG